MRIQIFKKIFYSNHNLIHLIPYIDNIISLKKSLKTDLCNYFRRIKLKSYQEKNKDRIRELNRQLSKKNYHSSLEKRNELLEKAKSRYHKNKSLNIKVYEKFILQ